MMGLMISEMEQKELEYVLKRELDEILFDFQDARIDTFVKRAMEERYKILFNLFKRVAPTSECMKYMRSKKPTMEKKDSI